MGEPVRVDYQEPLPATDDYEAEDERYIIFTPGGTLDLTPDQFKELQDFLDDYDMKMKE